ncbi:MAG: cobalamin-binding protein [Spirochaetaceae bacterium]|nr:MAG: cobalamin-binding protein [Spirochaetaceae bacterium]
MIDESVYREYFDALVVGDRAACHGIVQNLLEQDTEIRAVYVELFQRAMYEVGALWEENKISVATEHLATAITESLMTLVYPKIFSAEHIGRSAIVSAVSNEYHQIGAKMVADIFELNGWNGYFLGANTPTPDLVRAIVDRRPDVLALSLSISSNLPSLLEIIEQVRSFDDELPILVGGQAFRWIEADVILDFPRVEHLETLERLELFIRNN